MTYDGRIAAWMAAWQRLELIERERKRLAEVRNAVPPEFAEQMRAEAAVYARLAQAPAVVGMAAGDLLVAEENVRIKQANRVAESMADFGEKMTPTTEGDDDAASS